MRSPANADEIAFLLYETMAHSGPHRVGAATMLVREERFAVVLIRIGK